MFIDTLFFEFVHFLCEIGGGFFTPLFRFISFLGNHGWIFIVFGFVLMLRRKTRWIGLTIIFTIFFSGLLTEKVIKEIVARPRPYLSAAKNIYEYWLQAGAIEQEGFAMPSGHIVGTASFFFAYAISVKKEERKNVYVIGIICIFIMTVARCYLMHHHLTDCIVAAIIAYLFSYLGRAVSRLIFVLCKKYSNIWLFNFALNFDFFELFAPKKLND